MAAIGAWQRITPDKPRRAVATFGALCWCVHQLMPVCPTATAAGELIKTTDKYSIVFLYFYTSNESSNSQPLDSGDSITIPDIPIRQLPRSPFGNQICALRCARRTSMLPPEAAHRVPQSALELNIFMHYTRDARATHGALIDI